MVNCLHKLAADWSITCSELRRCKAREEAQLKSEHYLKSVLIFFYFLVSGDKQLEKESVIICLLSNHTSIHDHAIFGIVPLSAFYSYHIPTFTIFISTFFIVCTSLICTLLSQMPNIFIILSPSLFILTKSVWFGAGVDCTFGRERERKVKHSV